MLVGSNAMLAGSPGSATPKGSKGAKAGKGFKLPGSLNYTPDYSSLIQNDPAFSVLKQQIGAQQTQDAATRAQSINQSLIQYGAVPDFATAGQQAGLSSSAIQQLLGDIDPNTAGLAQQNTSAGLSTTAQLAAKQQQAMLALRNGLAARGGLSSGEDPYQTGLQDTAYAQAQNSALQSLLGAINGYDQTYTGNQQTEQGQLQQGMQTAEQNQEALGYVPTALHYNAKTGKYTSGAGGTYTPKKVGGQWIVTDDQTGQKFNLNPDGTLSAA